MRTRALMAMFVVLALLGAGVIPAAAQGSATPWAGTWETDLGTWVLEQSGAHVSGTYEPGTGRLVGTVSDGSLDGTWAQAPSYAAPADAGDLQVTLGASGTTFSGIWRHGTVGDWTTINGRLAGTLTPADPPSPEPAPAVTGGPLLMSPATLPSGIARGHLSAVIGAPSGLQLAVGGRGNQDRSWALILSSPDGRDWTTVSLSGDAATGDIVDITAFDGGLAAIGLTRAGDGAKVWWSSDGSAWESSSDPTVFGGTRPVAITTWDGGLFAVGCVAGADGACHGIVGWSSTDGLTWTRSDLDLKPTWQLRDAAGGGSQLLLVGSTTMGDGKAVVTTSSDAVTWTARVVYPWGSFAHAAVTDTGTLVATGTRFIEAGSTGYGVTSADGGLTWTDAEIWTAAGILFTGRAAGAYDDIVYGGEGPGQSEPIPMAWTLTDGTDLAAIEIADGAVTGMGVIEDALVLPGSRVVIAVGAMGDTLAMKPAAWIIEPAADVALVAPIPG